MTSQKLSNEELALQIDPLLLELARLSMFERLICKKAQADKDGVIGSAIAAVRQSPLFGPNTLQTRPLEVIDIPEILSDVNRALHGQLEKQARINSKRLYVAVSAFIAILCPEVKP